MYTNYKYLVVIQVYVWSSFKQRVMKINYRYAKICFDKNQHHYFQKFNSEIMLTKFSYFSIYNAELSFECT